MALRVVPGTRGGAAVGSVRVKVCGLRKPADIAAVVASGAAYAGFVFFPPSPRNLSLADAQSLALAAPPGLAKVALTVDADDSLLEEILANVPVDILQLHGHETPARVAQVRERFGLPVMKAIGVASEADLAALDDHAQAADMLLVDAKPPRGAAVPGGNGLAFDWRLIAGRQWRLPWMLAGGLTPDNVCEAVRLTGARQVDVSSGVESAPGQKDPGLIAAFCQAAAKA